MSIPKRHHYLPQSYLKEFSNDDVVWLFDRKKEEIRAQKIIDTAVISNFYSIEKPDGTKDLQIEKQLAKIDALIPNLIKSLRSRSILSEKERGEICFIAALFLSRTPDFREESNEMESALIKKIAQGMYQNLESVEKSMRELEKKTSKPLNVTPEKLHEVMSKGQFSVKINQNRGIERMVDFVSSISNTLTRLNMLILHAPRKSGFLTSDRPFVILPPQDTRYIAAWGGVGILTPGAQKYLALSSDMTLVFGDLGTEFNHLDLIRDRVKTVNAVIGNMASRFLIGRDQALIEAWSKRLKLRGNAKHRSMGLA